MSSDLTILVAATDKKYCCICSGQYRIANGDMLWNIFHKLWNQTELSFKTRSIRLTKSSHSTCCRVTIQPAPVPHSYTSTALRIHIHNCTPNTLTSSTQLSTWLHFMTSPCLQTEPWSHHARHRWLLQGHVPRFDGRRDVWCDPQGNAEKFHLVPNPVLRASTNTNKEKSANKYSLSIFCR